MGVFVRENCLTLADKAGPKSEEMNSEIWGNLLTHCFLLMKPQFSRKNSFFSNSFFSIPQSTKFAWIVLQKLDFEMASKKKNIS